MNQHFEDARYYLGRTASKVVAGVKTELEPVETAVRRRLGLETEEPTRRERLTGAVAAARRRATGAVRRVAREVREKAAAVRNSKRSA